MVRHQGVTVTAIALGLVLLLATGVSAFNLDTHRLLNGRASDRSGLDAYLIGELGLRAGTATSLSGNTVREWIRVGGANEDLFFGSELLGALFRSTNHFHNPLLPWDRAGLDAFSICPPFLLRGEASVRWAQDPDQGISGRAAWGDARRSFYQGLTLSAKGDREVVLARTFRMLGQQMHPIVLFVKDADDVWRLKFF